jgi:hypothetical protein
MKYFIFITLSILLILLLSSFVGAQSVPPPLLPSGPPQTPIDGGLGLLAVAGGGYALKKLRDRKKAEEEAM